MVVSKLKSEIKKQNEVEQANNVYRGEFEEQAEINQHR